MRNIGGRPWNVARQVLVGVVWSAVAGVLDGLLWTVVGLLSESLLFLHEALRRVTEVARPQATQSAREFDVHIGQPINSRLVNSHTLPTSHRFYVVSRGRNVGIYDNYREANAQTHGFSGYRLRVFRDRPEAEH
ncbi:unnamed protein product [Calypogeia fissa]